MLLTADRAFREAAGAEIVPAGGAGHGTAAAQGDFAPLAAVAVVFVHIGPAIFTRRSIPVVLCGASSYVASSRHSR
jgi:hypothetical protein